MCALLSLRDDFDAQLVRSSATIAELINLIFIFLYLPTYGPQLFGGIHILKKGGERTKRRRQSLDKSHRAYFFSANFFLSRSDQATPAIVTAAPTSSSMEASSMTPLATARPPPNVSTCLRIDITDSFVMICVCVFRV